MPGQNCSGRQAEQTVSDKEALAQFNLHHLFSATLGLKHVEETSHCPLVTKKNLLCQFL